MTNHPMTDLESRQKKLLLGEYRKALKAVGVQIKWYQDKKKNKKMFSQFFRAASIVMIGFGTLCPLVDATDILKALQISVSEWGFVFFAIGGMMLAADKFFGLSSAWMRFMITEMDISELQTKFKAEFRIVTAKTAENDGNLKISDLLEMIKKFRLDVHHLVRRETDIWVAEFKSRNSDLEKQIQLVQKKLN